MAKGILIDHVFKVFGDAPDDALALVRQGLSKKEIDRGASGQVGLGVVGGTVDRALELDRGCRRRGRRRRRGRWRCRRGRGRRHGRQEHRAIATTAAAAGDHDRHQTGHHARGPMFHIHLVSMFFDMFILT